MPQPPVILIAPNALKGSLAATAAAAAIANGIARACPDAVLRLRPVADGGDGMLEVLAAALHGDWIETPVTGPLGEPVSAPLVYCAGRRLAVLEMAAVAGLALLRPDRYDPLRTSTRGVGELIRAALDRGAREILLGIGGSATNDGGIGMAAALGAVFRDAKGQPLEPLAENLPRLARIDLDGLDPRLRETRFEVACDVDNPLLGPRGATRTYGPQKGAAAEPLERLETGLARLADCLESQLGRPLRELPGTGAAGGLGAGALAFLDAELRPGAELVLERLDFDGALEGADLVITAEGRLDDQTLHGKAPAAVARRAQARGTPCHALAGSLGEDLSGLHEAGFTGWREIRPPGMTVAESMRLAAGLLAAASERLARDRRHDAP